MQVEVKIDVVTDDHVVAPSLGVDVKQPALNAVLFDFNPSSNPKVTTIKALHAALIQVMNDLRDDPDSTSAQRRCASIAVTELEGTQMRAVKALFAKA